MVTNPTTNGGCFCGKVRFEAQGEPNSVSICHCNSCQRIAGADSVAWAGFPIDAVRWSGAKPTKFESSPGVERTFCAACGTSMSYQNKATSIDLALVCMDDPEVHKPQKEIWLDHRRSWNARDRSIPGYRKFRSTGLLAD